MYKKYVKISLGILCLLTSLNISAHSLGESYIYLNVTEQSLQGRIEITLNDANKVVTLDSNGDGVITESEFTASSSKIYQYLQPRLNFYSADLQHPVKITDHQFLQLDMATFAKINFTIPSIKKTPRKIDIEYRFLFDSVESTHRAFVVIESNSRINVEENEAIFSLIIGPGTERQNFSLDGDAWHEVFIDFIKHGVWHILIGFDHILFLVSLLLVAVFSLHTRQWIPVDTFREALINVIKVATLFTLAHTITLSLAALQIFTLPVSIVEAVIAFSITIVALNNLYPFLRSKSWLVVFGFGLFHGLGFANVLEPLGINQQSLVTALLGFNLGVELGQLAIIAVLFPILFILRKFSLYKIIVVNTGSIALIIISLFWFINRIVDIPYISGENLQKILIFFN